MDKAKRRASFAAGMTKRTDAIKADLHDEVALEVLGAINGAKNVTAFGTRGWDTVSQVSFLATGENSQDAKLAGLYTKSALVFACARELSNGVSSAPLQVGVMDDKNFEEMPDHEANALFYENPDYSITDIIDFIVTRLALTGASANTLSLFTNRLGVGEFTPIPTQIVSPVSQGPKLLGYEIAQEQGEPIKIKPNELALIAYNRPDTYHQWMSPLATAIEEVKADRERERLTQELLRNRNIPGGFIESEHQLGKDRRDQVLSGVAKASGTETGQRGGLLFLPKGLSYKDGSDVSDIDFSELNMITETRICMAFGVPPIVIQAASGLEQSTYSNYEEARRSFYAETIAPLWKKIADELTYAIFAMQGDREHVIRFDMSEVKELQRDQAELASEATELFAAELVTKNEARAILSLEPVDDGDDFKPRPEPSVFVQPGQAPPEDEDEEEAKRGAKAQAAIGSFDDSGDLERALQGAFNAQEKDALAQVAAGATEVTPAGWDDILTDAVRPILADIWEANARSALGRVGSAKSANVQGALHTKQDDGEELTPSQLNEAGREARETIEGEAVVPAVGLLAGVVAVAADSPTAVPVGLPGGTIEGTFNLVRPEVLEALETQLTELAKSTNLTTSLKLKSAIAEVTRVAREANTIPDLTAAVRKVFTSASAKQARVIAITESSRAMHDGQILAGATSGVVVGYKTIVSPDACPICQYYDNGEPTGVAVYPSQNMDSAKANVGNYGSDAPPFHPNCRCTQVEVLIGEAMPEQQIIPDGWQTLPKPSDARKAER